MIRILKFLAMYLVLAAVVLGVIVLDQTTPTFDSVRRLVGAEVGQRAGLQRINSLPVLVTAYREGQIGLVDGVELAFAARRWPDYRPALPEAPEGWFRHMPLMVDDMEIEVLDATLFTGMASLFQPAALGDDPQAQAAVKAMTAAMEAQVGASLAETFDSLPGMGGFEYKASAARYVNEKGNRVTVAVNKLWRSSIDAVNGINDAMRDSLAIDTREVAVNGRGFKVTRSGPNWRFHHNVNGHARVLVIGDASHEEMLGFVAGIDLDAIYAFHRAEEQGGAGGKAEAPKRAALPTIR